MNCIKCGKKLNDFESLVMLDVPNNAYCLECGLNNKKSTSN